MFPSMYDTQFIDWNTVPVTSTSIREYPDLYEQIRKHVESQKKYCVINY